MASCILYQNDDSTITLLDIPRSIESSQGDPTRRIISTVPLENPFPSVEPKSAKAKSKLGEVSIEDLLLQKHLQLALDGLREAYDGDWCLPRVTEKAEKGAPGKKRKRKEILSDERDEKGQIETRSPEPVTLQKGEPSTSPIFFKNPTSTPMDITSEGLRARIPPRSTILQGEIAATIETFNSNAPRFNLITMDPPWPNRSARRKSSYATSYSSTDIQSLLSSIPIKDHLDDEGLVAVWVTNKPAFRDMLLEEGGLFDEWGIELVEECVWVKVTVNGNTICALNSLWRKPYEILLVGRKEMNEAEEVEVKRRVIVAVPDLHSRKPNLKVLLERLLNKEKYEALEIFARNLTAGWWAWGDEALKFQTDEHWIQEANPRGPNSFGQNIHT
jgi:N6-adenosine-specific RNA methylase IME4